MRTIKVKLKMVETSASEADIKAAFKKRGENLSNAMASLKKVKPCMEVIRSAGGYGLEVAKIYDSILVDLTEILASSRGYEHLIKTPVK